MDKKETRPGINFGQVAGTFALGATVGSLVALLYAPASGRTTRKRLKLKFRAIQRSATQLGETAAKRITSAREWVTGHMGNGNGRRLKPHPVH